MIEIIMNLLLSLLGILLLAAALVLTKLAQIMKWEQDERKKNHGKEK